MDFSLKHKATIMAFHQGERGPFHVFPQFWDGQRIDFYFEDEKHGGSGVFQFQADTGQLGLQLLKPFSGFSSEQELSHFLVNVFKSFSRFYHFGWSPEPQEIPKYDRDYHERSGYLQANDHELAVKKFQADMIVKLASPCKTLVSGCSSGELVRQLRNKNVDAWGFDIMPDLNLFVVPDIKDFVRSGSMSQIPFDAADGFETLIALDVLEHIPENQVSIMLQEWLRLDLKQIVTLINFNQFSFEGHVTLRPPHWWKQQFQDHFKMVNAFRLDAELLYENDNDENHEWWVLERTS